MRNLLKSIYRNQNGTTAVEFAIISPVFILLIFGTIGLCSMLFLVGSLQFAVEDGARCASVGTVCPDVATTLAHTQRRYAGPGSPTFTYNAAAPCGKSVSALINYSMDVGLKTFAIPISATACYP